MKFRLLFIILLIFGYLFLLNSLYDCSAVGVSNDDNKKNLISEESISFEGEEYLGFISIPKIGIERNLYPINSEKNTVDKNIEVLKDSDMPDAFGGNFILAAHNGDSSIAYFHNLDKLEIGDEVIIGYNDVDYRYVIADIYDVIKTGKVAIKRDRNKKTITLITCKGNDKQLVVIGYIK